MGGPLGDVHSVNMPRSADTLIRMLGLPFKEGFRIDEALTHRSASHERGKKKPIPNYERLEFLGDRVIGLIVAEYLLNAWPLATEGEVGQIFSTIVSTQTLASIARRMDLGSYMVLGKGSHSSGERDNPSLLADTFESMAAAIYVEYGLEMARQILIPWFAQPLQDILRTIEAANPREPLRHIPAPVEPAERTPSRDKGRNPPNYKLLIQKWAQQNFSRVPEVSILSESGPSHQKVFVMGISVGKVLLEQGSGNTKRGATFHALEQLWGRIQSGFMPEIHPHSGAVNGDAKAADVLPAEPTEHAPVVEQPIPEQTHAEDTTELGAFLSIGTVPSPAETAHES